MAVFLLVPDPAIELQLNSATSLWSKHGHLPPESWYSSDTGQVRE